jgi:hypothetical protein
MKSLIGLLFAITLLAAAPPAAADEEDEAKAVPLGDVHDEETTASIEGTVDPAATSEKSSVGDKSVSSSDRADAEKASDDDEEAEGWRVEGAFGAHLTVPKSEHDGTGELAGGGIHLFMGGRPGTLPITLGAEFGFDSFLPHTELFTYDDLRANWSIKRRGIWMLPTVSFSPADTAVRPFLRIHGGLWLHDVRIEAENEWDESESHDIDLDATGAYGASVGIDFRLRKVRVGLSVLYLRGGGVTLPDYRNATVENDRLVLGEMHTGAISQWTFGLELAPNN